MRSISLIKLMEARSTYHKILNSLGKQYLYGAPSIQRFLSPANYSMFPEDLNEYSSPLIYPVYDLSKTGEKRYEMLHSPHARALIAVLLTRRA